MFKLNHGFDPAARADYESRCERVSPEVFRLNHPVGFVPEFYKTWNKTREIFYARFVPILPDLDEAIRWLKARNPHWSDLQVTLAPLSANERGMTLGQTIPSLHCIELTPDGSDWVNTIAHEFAHVSQYAGGRLEEGAAGQWQGHDYSVSVMAANMGSKRAYESLPWEKEARAFSEAQAPLIRAYLDTMPHRGFLDRG